MNNLPTHIAVIPDGNRRWARKHKLDAWLGHEKGTENLEKFADVIIKLNIPHLSFWGSSRDNLKKRPGREVKFLLNLFKKEFFKLSNSEKIHKNRIKINIFGSWREQFPDDIKKSLDHAVESTKNYSDYFFNFFIAYSGTDEIINAVKCVARKFKKNPSLLIDKNLFKNCLFTGSLPPVDLVIRTGGEPHLSDGFMMWEVANAQLYFSEKLWPDFNRQDFINAIEDYSKRERRFGR